MSDHDDECFRGPTIEDLEESYLRLKSVWKVAKEFGMSGQSVHRRLEKLNTVIQKNNYTEREVRMIKNFYETGFLCGELKDFCKSIDRPISGVSRFARKHKLTNSKRKNTEDFKTNVGIRQKKYIKENGHPRGMLGKTHTEENRKSISKSVIARWNGLSILERNILILKRMKTKEKNGTLVDKNQKVSWKQSWRTIGEKKSYFRSSWEANYARYLQYLKEKNQIKEWEHEPKTFWFLNVLRGCRSYLPDFRVTNIDNSFYWVEVKGYMDDKSKTKLKRFKKYYPEEKIILIDSNWYNKNKKKLCLLISGWES